MAVETQWASREELQALRAAQAEDRQRIAYLEGYLGVSLAAYQAGRTQRAERVPISVEKDLGWIRWLLVAVLALSFLNLFAFSILLAQWQAGG